MAVRDETPGGGWHIPSWLGWVEQSRDETRQADICFGMCLAKNHRDAPGAPPPGSIRRPEFANVPAQFSV